MQRLTKSLALPAAILVAGCMAAGCSSGAKNAIASLAPTRSASVAPSHSASPSPTHSASPPPTHSATSAPSNSASPSRTASASVTPSTVTPTRTAQPGSPAAVAGESGTGLVWLWILLGAIVLIGMIVLIARSRSRRSAAAAGWQSRVIDAYAKGSALHDAMSVAETPGALAAADAGARWSDIQRRADDLAQTLYALREAAPDDGSRARAADALASLQAVRSAMDAERAPGGAGAQQAEVARGRLAAFEASLRALRAPDQQAP
jgi:hypothetical protein